MKDNLEDQGLLWEPQDRLEYDVDSLQRMIPSQETNYITHNLQIYPARFIPHFPKVFIKNLTNENEFVVDPMMGGGTTLIEAAISNRRGFGIDIDPIAYLIAKVSTTPIETRKLRSRTRNFYKNVFNSFKKEEWKNEYLPSEEEYPNHSLWFRSEILKQLIFLRNKIKKIRDKDTKNLAFLALSSIVKDVSNADPRDIFPERDKNMPLRPKQDVLKKFYASLYRLQEKVIEFSSIVNFEKRIEIQLGDARNVNLDSNCADLVFTSSPYAYAIDYARVNQLSTLLLCMDNKKLKDYRKKYIGTDRVSVSTNIKDFAHIHFAKNEIEKILKKDKKCALVLYNYFHDMTKVTKECHRILKKGKYLVYVIGNSTIKGSPFSTESIFIDICKEIGFSLERKFTRPYFSYRMSTKRNIQSNKIKEDIFLMFKK